LSSSWREVLGEDALELGVFRFDCPHGVVDGLADFGLVGVFGNPFPAGALGHEEDALRRVLVAVLFEALALVDELLVLLLELVGDVLEEDEPQHDALVLGGVQVAAKLVRRLPDLLLEADFRRVVLLCLALCHA